MRALVAFRICRISDNCWKLYWYCILWRHWCRRFSHDGHKPIVVVAVVTAAVVDRFYAASYVHDDFFWVLFLRTIVHSTTQPLPYWSSKRWPCRSSPPFSFLLAVCCRPLQFSDNRNRSAWHILWGVIVVVCRLRLLWLSDVVVAGLPTWRQALALRLSDQPNGYFLFICSFTRLPPCQQSPSTVCRVTFSDASLQLLSLVVFVFSYRCIILVVV